jgi:hypothetical protein
VFFVVKKVFRASSSSVAYLTAVYCPEKKDIVCQFQSVNILCIKKNINKRFLEILISENPGESEKL